MKDEIPNMPAGLEMDKLITAHVLNKVLMYWDGELLNPDIVKPYSTDIAAAWEVAEETKVMTNNFRLVFYDERDFPHMGTGWYACFGPGSEHGVFAETAPLAIYRAVLLATMLV